MKSKQTHNLGKKTIHHHITNNSCILLLLSWSSPSFMTSSSTPSRASTSSSAGYCQIVQDLLRWRGTGLYSSMSAGPPSDLSHIWERLPSEMRTRSPKKTKKNNRRLCCSKWGRHQMPCQVRVKEDSFKERSSGDRSGHVENTGRGWVGDCHNVRMFRKPQKCTSSAVWP